MAKTLKDMLIKTINKHSRKTGKKWEQVSQVHHMINSVVIELSPTMQEKVFLHIYGFNYVSAKKLHDTIIQKRKYLLPTIEDIKECLSTIEVNGHSMELMDYTSNPSIQTVTKIAEKVDKKTFNKKVNKNINKYGGIFK